MRHKLEHISLINVIILHVLILLTTNTIENDSNTNPQSVHCFHYISLKTLELFKPNLIFYHCVFDLFHLLFLFIFLTRLVFFRIFLSFIFCYVSSDLINFVIYFVMLISEFMDIFIVFMMLLFEFFEFFNKLVSCVDL